MVVPAECRFGRETPGGVAGQCTHDLTRAGLLGDARDPPVRVVREIDPAGRGSIVATARKLARVIYAVLRDGKPCRDPEVDYEALLVKRKAPRWIPSCASSASSSDATTAQ